METLKDKFNKLKPFNTIDDVPDLPITNKDEWENFYIPKLIKLGAIPKKDLVINQYYVGNHRRAVVAKWLGDKFVYRREKYNQIFDDFCNHFEDDNGLALFVPLKIGTVDEFEKNTPLV